MSRNTLCQVDKSLPFGNRIITLFTKGQKYGLTYLSFPGKNETTGHKMISPEFRVWFGDKKNQNTWVT